MNKLEASHSQKLRGLSRCNYPALKPFNSQIKFVILLTVNHTMLIMLGQRI